MNTFTSGDLTDVAGSSGTENCSAEVHFCHILFFFLFGPAQLTVNVVNVVPTSWCHHVFQVCNKIIFLISFVGNRGTFTRGYKVMVLDFEFLYHLLYLIICCLGVFLHVFFYSLLVRAHMYTSTTSTRHLPPELRSKNEKNVKSVDFKDRKNTLKKKKKVFPQTDFSRGAFKGMSPEHDSSCLVCSSSVALLLVVVITVHLFTTSDDTVQSHVFVQHNRVFNIILFEQRGGGKNCLKKKRSFVQPNWSLLFVCFIKVHSPKKPNRPAAQMSVTIIPSLSKIKTLCR